MPIGYFDGENAVMDAAFIGCDTGRRLVREGRAVRWQNGLAEKLKNLEQATPSVRRVRVYQLKPDVDPASCPYGVENEDDGCGSTHMVCKGCVMGGDEGCKGQSEPCAPNQKQEICKDCTGMNRYICTDKDDTCPFGSKKTCGENEIQIGSAVTEAGSACAVCRPKTCEDAGLMSTKPEGQVCSTTTYAGQTCYLDCQ